MLPYNKLISIVIPTYNRSEKLEILLQSLAGQKYDRLKTEIIVVDDCSKDNTAEIVLRFKDMGVNYIMQDNSGPAAARNNGWKNSSGMFVGFLDSDVIAGDNYLSSAITYLENNPGLDCVEGRTLSKIMDIKPTYFTHSVENLNGGQYMTCNIFYSRFILEKIGGFDVEYHKPYIREDTDIAFAAIKAGGKTAFAENLVVYHPVYKSSYRDIFKLALQGIHEPRLFMKYPSLYFKKMKWLDGWFFPVYYLGYYIFPALAIPGFAMKDSWLVNTGFLFYLLSYCVTLYAQFRKKIVLPQEFLTAAALFTFIPYLRLYWLIIGFIKHSHLLFGGKFGKKN